jgi:hypothetical protein
MYSPLSLTVLSPDIDLNPIQKAVHLLYRGLADRMVPTFRGKHREFVDKYPCPERDANPKSEGLNGQRHVATYFCKYCFFLRKFKQNVLRSSVRRLVGARKRSSCAPSDLENCISRVMETLLQRLIHGTSLHFFWSDLLRVAVILHFLTSLEKGLMELTLK